MGNREKVISDLEEQIAWIRDNDFHKFPGWGHAVLAMRDALALLKEQEPRLVVETDFENADAYGFLPVWVEDKDDSEIVCDCIMKAALADMDSGYHYRYWTSRPTDEQSKAVKWE